MKILFCSSEVSPFAKTGGLADVAGALPLALESLGHEVRIILPKYKMVKEPGDFAIIGKGVKVKFVCNDNLYMRDGIYGDEHGDYPDNLKRFSYYCKAALDYIKEDGFQPDIIHCNDWQTGLIPVYLKTLYKDDEFYKNIRTVLTIHNLAYTGSFKKGEFPVLGLDASCAKDFGFEYYGKISLLKAGLENADILTTVSKAYAKEIQTKEFGCGLEDLLVKRSSDLYGVINGIDYSIWDPVKDNYIYKNYGPDNLNNKVKNKKKLIKDLGLSVDVNRPLFGAVGRLAHQKGFDLISEVIESLVKIDAGIIILGTGEKKYHDILTQKQKGYADRVSVNLEFDERLAHKIYAASDMFIMASRYEPCGLGQLISFKYGAVPVVRSTGGLADTVKELDVVNGTGEGFVFYDNSSESLFKTMKHAVEVFENKKVWSKLVKKIVSYDFSWNESAKEYERIYGLGTLARNS
ncbi:MAG: glycogen/starch synthase [Candidatus Omnitrophota bacterium]